MRTGGEPFQPALNTPVSLDQGQLIGQTINPAGHRVRQLDVSVATFAAAADPEGELVVVLRDPANRDVLATTVVPGIDIEDGAWVSAGFDPPASVGDLVLAEFNWDGVTPLALWADTTLEGTRGITNDPYPEGELVIDGRPADGDLAFRVVSGPSVTVAAGQLGGVVRSLAAGLRDQPVFAVLWLLVLAGATLTAVVGFRRR
ncbi:MAG: hypothetical protein ACR2HR_07675 [Euzebya sp.]